MINPAERTEPSPAETRQPLYWYADNSDLHGIWNAEIQDILMFGGIVINETGQGQLDSIIREVKHRYASKDDVPLKWCFQDLAKSYKEHGKTDLYLKLLKEQDKWRSEILQRSKDIDFTIIVSMILGYSSRREVLIRTRDPLTRFVFSDALMRVGLHVKEFRPGRAEVILDWPPAGQRDLYVEEYMSAHRDGVTVDQQKYYCGKLKELSFNSSCYFTPMEASSLLQFSDLIIGATRGLVEVALGKKKASLGLELVRQLKEKIRGAPSRAIGRGIIIAPTQGEFYDKIREVVTGLYT